MTVIQKKVCMLGAFAVGKTSLVRRFVHSVYSEKYHTTVGVKIDRKEIQVGDRTVKLLLWDLAGEDDFNRVPVSYINGSAALFFVADGTRRETLDRVHALRELARGAVGDVPSLVALNKADLEAEWELEANATDELTQAGFQVYITSAKTGHLVEQAFQWLGEQLVPQG